MALLSLALCLVVLLVAVVLAFAYAGLQQRLREIEALVLRLNGKQRSIQALSGENQAVVLVTEHGCLSCVERLSELREAVAKAGDVRFFVAHNGPDSDLAMLPAEVDRLDFASNVTELDVAVFPVAILFDQHGTETMRRIAGDPDVLPQLLFEVRSNTIN